MTVFVLYCFFFFFKQKTAYEMRISDWSSDVCSSDLEGRLLGQGSVKFKLNSQGQTMAALEAGLKGSVQARVRNGAIKGINVAQTLREANEVVRNVFSGQLPDVATQFDTGRQTDFTALNADIDYDHGQGTVKKLNLVAPLLRV